MIRSVKFIDRNFGKIHCFLDKQRILHNKVKIVIVKLTNISVMVGKFNMIFST